MLRLKRIATSLFFTAVIGSFTAVAQTPQQMAPQQQQQVEVNDEELTKFANAYQGITVINQQAQQEMIKVVEDSGFDVKRFNEIHQASLDPNKEVEVTSEEKAQHKEVVSEIEGMQSEFQAEMEEVIKEQGLSVERYEQLAMALQRDTALQQRLQKLMQRKG
ncbi:DUF4168 domain-containing protein [Salegentibacter sediminis]|uniref:DUF4168 domain-containing protein n=1 Tax=Salegentibacter sediminis TaxID=1930251 RepID=UPI0009C17462|nr:DUF4168 domain-containing protein [Salegentibacter sediminis]